MNEELTIYNPIQVASESNPQLYDNLLFYVTLE